MPPFTKSPLDALGLPGIDSRDVTKQLADVVRPQTVSR